MVVNSCAFCLEQRLDNHELCDDHFRQMNRLPPRFNRLKQRLVLKAIANALYLKYGIETQTEQVVMGGESKVFLDMVFTHNDRRWVVEVDEHAHRAYNAEKEMERLQFVHKHWGVFSLVRINPDEWYDPLRKKVAAAICTKCEALVKDNDTLRYSRHELVHIDQEEVTRRVGIVMEYLQRAFSGSGYMGERLFDGDVVMMKLFYG